MKKIGNPKIQKVKSLGLDFDGVIVDHTQTKIALAKNIGFKLRPEETASKVFKTMIPKKEYSSLKRKLYGTFATTFRPMSGVMRNLKRLHENNVKIFVVSRRKVGSRAAVKNWIQNQIGGIIEKDNIFFVERDVDKKDVCKKLGIDIFLDDKLEVLEPMLQIKKRFVFDPHNVHRKITGIKIIKSWDEFTENII